MKIQHREPEIPKLVPRPFLVKDINNPVLTLDGMWKVKHTGDFNEARADVRWMEWDEIPVPSDMEVYRNHTEGWTGCYAYKKQVFLPREMAGKELVLRFEGINGFARVYIDDIFVAEHKNGFISWNRNITGVVGEKRDFVLTVEVDDTAEKVCSFNHGGMIHSVMLYALPDNHLTMLHSTTTMKDGRDLWSLRVDFAISRHDTDVQYQFELIDPSGKTVLDDFPVVCIPEGGDSGTAEWEITSPLLWDAEHPWLYRLKVSLWKKEQLQEQVMHRFGFRQITRVQNQLFVNGDEVKLRGVCRHEASALHGRALTRELIEQDVALFKEANCNYIRTSHYPPCEYFLDLCDEKGIYVEDELDLAFIARTLNYTQRDPAQTERYLSLFAEVMARDYSHPCIIIWSLANESFGGHNFDLLNRFAHRMDPTRPTKFSYPMTMREEHEPVDIWSIHYSNLEEDLAKKCDNVSVGYTPGKDTPVLHDEYAHIPCYNRTEHRRDPNVRNFWGQSIKRFWDKIWDTRGALGGAIWAGIDQTSLFVGGNISLEWGIIDAWRRKKPEHYLTRKAYSPIVLYPETAMKAGNQISITLENRFCHTNLSEVLLEWSWGTHSGTAPCPNVKPRGYGSVFIPIPQNVSFKEPLDIFFVDGFGNRVDEYQIIPSELLDTWRTKFCDTKTVPINETAAISCQENENTVTVSGMHFTLVFDKDTGLIRSGEVQKNRILVGGPFLNTPYLRLEPWKKTSFSFVQMENTVVVKTSGSYGTQMDVTFSLTIQADGTIVTDYTIDKLNVPLPKQVKLRVGVDCGGLDEIGVYFIADRSLNTLQWKRKGQWTIYPADHIARCEGIATRRSCGSEFGKKPEIPWSQEMKSFILNGRYDVDYKGTNDFRSLKEHVLTAALYKAGEQGKLEAVSDGSHSVRLEIQEPNEKIVPNGDPRIVYRGSWYPMEDFAGSRDGTEMWTKEAGACAELTFEGTGVVWYGPVDTIYGIARVYVDGKLMDAAIDQRVSGVDFPGSAAGYDKKYNYPVYSISGLENKTHTIRIEASGETGKGGKDSYIVLDYFRIIGQEGEEPIRFIINNDYNYPHIAWGNYSKPAIIIDTGYHNHVITRLCY